MAQSSNSNPDALALIIQFAQARGMPAEQVGSVRGLEFESESGLVARASPHPQDEGRLMIDIEILTLEDAVLQARNDAVLALHQLNYAARFEHDWMIVIDDGSVLTIGTSLDVAYLDDSALESHLAEGVERAQALRTLWQELVSSAGNADDTEPAQTASLTAPMIRA
jgi:hypothetical protein